MNAESDDVLVPDDLTQLDRCIPCRLRGVLAPDVCVACDACLDLCDEVDNFHQVAYKALHFQLTGGVRPPDGLITLQKCFYCHVENPDHLGRNCPKKPMKAPPAPMQETQAVTSGP
jgi:ferredoxin